MNPLHEIVAINNKAAHLFSAGDDDESVTGSLPEFERALKILMKASQELSQNDSCEDVKSIRRRSSFSFFPHRDRLVGLQSVHGFVYNHPLLLATDAQAPCRLDLDLSLASATVLFNSALAWHYRGRRTGKALPLLRARQLYDLVFTVLESTEMCHNDNQMCLLECLALNNLALVHYELGDYAQSQMCHEYIQDNLQAGGGCNLEAYIDADEADEIRFNVEFFQIPTSASAA